MKGIQRINQEECPDAVLEVDKDWDRAEVGKTFEELNIFNKFKFACTISHHMEHLVMIYLYVVLFKQIYIGYEEYFRAPKTKWLKISDLSKFNCYGFGKVFVLVGGIINLKA